MPTLTRPRHRRDETGAALITLALCLVMLMTFAAFVIDIGATYLERRQDQSAADAGALAGAARLLSASTSNMNQVGQDAVEIARLNMTGAPTVAAWNDLFAACTDTTRNMTEFPAGTQYRPLLTDGRATDCVHFNRSFTRVRVRIPDQLVATTFARVIGINTLRTSAFAEAQLVPFRQTSIPFGLQSGAGNPQDLLCVRLDNSCSGPVNQDTRFLDSPTFGNTQMGTTLVCGSAFGPPGDSNPGTDPTLRSRAANNAAMGLDHMVVVRAAGEPQRRDDCGTAGSLTPQSLPNSVYATEFDNFASNSPAAAANYMSGIADGLVFGGTFSDGKPARFLRYPGGWETRTISRGGTNYEVDDRPLFDFIRPGAANIPALCDRASFDIIGGDPNTTGPGIQHLVNCLNAFNPATNSPMFDMDSDGDGTFDIEWSTRAGVFPLTGVPGGTSYPPSRILSFQTGFLQTMYFSASSSCSPCTVYDAGIDPGGDPPVVVNGMNLVGLAVFRITDPMLPEHARPKPFNNIPATLSLTR